MVDRLVIEISGNLPDEGKFAMLANAEKVAQDAAAILEEKHPGMKLSISVKAVRPSKKTAAPAAVVQRRAAE